jgi:hypothetical protein
VALTELATLATALVVRIFSEEVEKTKRCAKQKKENEKEKRREEQKSVRLYSVNNRDESESEEFVVNRICALEVLSFCSLVRA